MNRWFRAWWLAPENPESSASAWAIGLNSLLVALFLAALFAATFAQLRIEWNWAIIGDYRNLFWKGWLETLKLSAISLVLSAFIGAAAAAAGRSRILALRALYRFYIEMARGAPLLIHIMVGYYVIADALGWESRFWVGITILSAFAGAYIAEILRSGIESIGTSQRDAAKAIGLSTAQTYRFVIIPQMTRQLLPPLAGQFVSLIKDSSLLSIIAIEEFTFAAQSVNAITYSAFESYLPLLLGYWALTIPISLWTRRLEERAAYET